MEAQTEREEGEEREKSLKLYSSIDSPGECLNTGAHPSRPDPLKFRIPTQSNFLNQPFEPQVG